MRLPCPLCGDRSIEEFTCLGDAAPRRPNPATADAEADAWHDYVYLRDNPRGRHRELWQHVHGCRAWLTVTRDTVTHAVFDAVLSRDEGGHQA